jgi:hypothetical protein
MRTVTILLVALVVLATVAVAVADEKDKPEGIAGEFTRGLLNCDNAIPVQCGSVVQGTNAGITSLVLNYYGCAWNEGGGEVVYTLTVPGPNVWTITATLSSYTQDPDVFILSACDEATNMTACTGNVTATVNAQPAGTYYIVVDQYGTAPTTPSTWTITITCSEMLPPCCPFPLVCNFIDFNLNDGGYTTILCGGGVTTWQWGVPTGTGIPMTACDNVPVTNVLATNLAGNYPVNAGEIAMVGPFTVTDECYCLELCHHFDSEASFDGGNVQVSLDGGATWTRIVPAAGYWGTANTSPMCIPSQPVFTGHTYSTVWRRECFDVRSYIGHQIWVGFHFGSDSSVVYRGWAIKWLKLGGYPISPVEEKSWGSIKSLYR